MTRRPATRFHTNYPLDWALVLAGSLVNEPPPFPETTEFDWDAVEDPADCPDKFAVEIFTATLAWLITFCMSSPRHHKAPKTLEGRANLKTGYRRFIALCYVYRPDLLDGRTIRALSEELNVSRQEINKYIADVSLEFKQRGHAQRAQGNRAIFRAAQLRAAAKRNTKRNIKRLSK